MRKLVLIVVALFLAGTGSASAHQPVVLLDTDTTAANGPLLADGTISFAIRAAFTKAGEKKAFRASFLEGDAINVQYLIVDKKPENILRPAQLPTIVLTSPNGSSVTMTIKERTKFFEPFGKVSYLYLARYSAVAQSGVYNFMISAKGRASITIAVGDREIMGQVLRGATSTPTPTPQSGYTMVKVKENNSATSCWSVINGNVYNLTQWINSHPGGQSAIRALCGLDGSASFNGRHGGQSNPIATLDSYLLGPLAK